MRRFGLITAAAFFIVPIMALPASASTCVPGSTDSYEALDGGGCQIGPLTFYDFSFTPTSGITFTGITPISDGGEYGFLVSFVAVATPNSPSDLSISYDVAGASPGTVISDVIGSVNGSVAPIGDEGGEILLSEQLTGKDPAVVLNFGCSSTTNGCSFSSLISPPNTGFQVGKDQENVSLGGVVGTSQITNEFSVSAVPIPAALPLFAGGLGVLGLFGRRKRRKLAAAAV